MNIKSKLEDKEQIIKEDIKYGILWNNILTISYFVNLIILVFVFFYVKKFNWLYFILLANAIIFTGIRGLYPVLEDERQCMYSYVTPIITRTCATIAEISLGALIMFMTINILIHIQKQNKNKKKLFELLEKICYLVIFLPMIANMNCWMGVSTKLNLFNSIEESLWTIYAIFLLIVYLLILKNVNNKIPKYYLIRNTCIIGSILLFLYIIYMIILDVPMYLKKYLYIIEDNKIEKVNTGIRNMYNCDIMTKKYSDWKNEILWMSSYFISLMLVLFLVYYINAQFI